MNREQATWVGGGLIFGFIAGFVLAYALTAETTVGGGPIAVPPRSSGGGAAAPSGSGAATADDPHGDVMARIEQLKAHLEEHPDSVPVLLDLSSIYLQAGMADSALQFLDRLRGVEPANFQARLYRIMAYQQLGRDSDAKQVLDDLETDAPDRWETHYLLAWYYLGAGADADRARRALDRVEELNPDLPALEELRLEAERLQSVSPAPEPQG